VLSSSPMRSDIVRSGPLRFDAVISYTEHEINGKKSQGLKL